MNELRPRVMVIVAALALLSLLGCNLLAQPKPTPEPATPTPIVIMVTVTPAPSAQSVCTDSEEQTVIGVYARASPAVVSVPSRMIVRNAEEQTVQAVLGEQPRTW